MAELFTVLKDGALLPAASVDRDALDGMRQGIRLATSISVPGPTNEQRRFYWGLVHIVAEGLGKTKEQLHFALRIDCQAFEQILPLGDGRQTVFVALKSIRKHGGMDDREFTAFREQAVEVLFTKYLPGVRRLDVYRRVLDATGLRKIPW